MGRFCAGKGCAHSVFAFPTSLKLPKPPAWDTRPRNIRVAAAASPRPVPAEHPRAPAASPRAEPRAASTRGTPSEHGFLAGVSRGLRRFRQRSREVVRMYKKAVVLRPSRKSRPYSNIFVSSTAARSIRGERRTRALVRTSKQTSAAEKGLSAAKRRWRERRSARRAHRGLVPPPRRGAAPPRRKSVRG